MCARTCAYAVLSICCSVCLRGQEKPADPQSLLNDARASYMHGDYPAARATLAQAWKLAQAQLPEDSPARYDVLKRLALANAATGGFNDADMYLQLAIWWREKVNGAADPRIADDLTQEASYCRAMKDFDRGLALLERAVEMHRAAAGGVDDVAVANDYSRMAEIDTDRHRPVDAVGALNMAIAIHSKLTGPLDPSVVPDLDRLGPVYISLGEYDNAEWIFRQALLIRESVYGNKNPDLIATVDGLAYALFGEKKYDEADPLYQRLLGLWADSVGEKHAMVAMALDKVAVFYTEQKKFPQARDASDRANAIRSYGLAMGLATEAARLQLTSPDEARDLYRRALRALDPPNPIYDELHAKLAANLELLKPGKPAPKTAAKTAR
ncbi:MAG: tetratricopeptide repeat protein [Bryobacteraceae bacterium]|jgi:tetratricopeptide (TPR) repeat protein